MRFSLILATVERTDEVRSFLASLLAQTYQDFELVVVDQNPDDRLVPLLALYMEQFPIVHLRSAKGLSKARNVGLNYVSGDVVAFPDDDCQYPPDLLEQTARFLFARPEIDGLTGRVADLGDDSLGHFDSKPGFSDRFNIWRRTASISIFLRRDSIRDLWFDETLGFGSNAPADGGEDYDYLLQLLDQGASLYYDPGIVVIHPPLTGVDARAIRRTYAYARGMGRVLRTRHYPVWFVSYRLARPLGGTLLALVRGQKAKAGHHWAMFRGRMAGLLLY